MKLDPLIRRLTIRTKRGGLAPLTPNWAQQRLLDEISRQDDAQRPVRVITLKARQLGISTISEATLFARSFLNEQSHSLVIAHHSSSSEHLFGMTRLYWDQFPFKKLYTAKYHSKRELAWTETGSSIQVATAGSTEVGRGRTINSLHASEVAFWEFPDEIMLGLRQTIPQSKGSLIILESTANGVGDWFYNAWSDAVSGDSDFVPLFFPWWEHHEYTASYTGVRMELKRLSSEEKLLQRMGVDDDHLVWRRWAIANLANGDIQQFHQEYPSSPEEAFITAGSNVFPLEKLREAYEPMSGQRGLLSDDGNRVRFIPDPTGPLTLFRLPSKDKDWGQYFVGGDPAHATRQDYACAQVLNRRMYEQVATWRGHIDPITFGDELVRLARFFNNAEISSEVEGPGYATIGRLLSLNYPNIWRHRWPDRLPGKVAPMYGWSTNWKRKDWMLSEVVKRLVDQTLTVHDRQTYEEMRSYARLPGGSNSSGFAYGPADAAMHDDCVMALCIAVVCSVTEGVVMPYESREYQDTLEPPAWEEWGESS